MYRPLPPLPPPPPPTGTGRRSATVGVGADDLVSGEAVALELPASNIGLRIVSGLIDFITGYLLWFGARYLAFLLVGDTDDALVLGSLTLATIVAFVGYPTLCETVFRGKTLGHWAMGLRTVRDDAGPIGFRQALTRALIGVVEIYGCTGLPALITAAITRKNKRLGDILAGTYVISDRHRIKLPPSPAMPLALAHWAQHADMATLPPALTANIRQFLARRGTITPASRSQFASHLAAATLGFVSPAPPPDAPAEAVLEAVMAERRNRDAARIARDNRLRRRLLR